MRKQGYHFFFLILTECVESLMFADTFYSLVVKLRFKISVALRVMVNLGQVLVGIRTTVGG